jgi:CRP/FNR family transcriptional regulator, cyclic AMP receptor protein
VARFRKDTKIDALKRSPLFEGLTSKQLARVAGLTDDLDVPPGTVLCNEGSLGHEFFVIIDGEAVVTQGGKHVTKLGPGDFFGEVALLGGVRRTASVIARTSLKFFVVSDSTFRSLVNSGPDIERKIMQALVRRVGADQTHA